MTVCLRKLGLHFALLYAIMFNKSKSHPELKGLIEPLLVLATMLFGNFDNYVTDLFRVSRSRKEENILICIHNLEETSTMVVDYRIINHLLRMMLSFVELTNDNEELELLLRYMIIIYYPPELIKKFGKVEM